MLRGVILKLINSVFVSQEHFDDTHVGDACTDLYMDTALCGTAGRSGYPFWADFLLIGSRNFDDDDNNSIIGDTKTRRSQVLAHE